MLLMPAELLRPTPRIWCLHCALRARVRLDRTGSFVHAVVAMLLRGAHRRVQRQRCVLHAELRRA